MAVDRMAWTHEAAAREVKREPFSKAECGVPSKCSSTTAYERLQRHVLCCHHLIYRSTGLIPIILFSTLFLEP